MRPTTVPTASPNDAMSKWACIVMFSARNRHTPVRMPPANPPMIEKVPSNPNACESPKPGSPRWAGIVNRRAPRIDPTSAQVSTELILPSSNPRRRATRSHTMAPATNPMPANRPCRERLSGPSSKIGIGL